MQKSKGQRKNSANEKHLIDIVAQSSISTTAREAEEDPPKNIPKTMRLALLELITRLPLKHLVKVKGRKEEVIKSSLQL